MTRQKAVKKLRRLADDLENANYHLDCEFMDALANKLDEQEPVEMEDLIKFIIKWWKKYV